MPGLVSCLVNQTQPAYCSITCNSMSTTYHVCCNYCWVHNLDCSKIDSNLSQMWVFAHGVVLGLSKDHNVAELIVKKGLLPYHIRELKVQRMISIDKVCYCERKIYHIIMLNYMYNLNLVLLLCSLMIAV